MAQFSNRSLIHRRISCFVRWIATENDREDAIRDKSADIRERICNQAKKDGLVIRSTPYSGSYAKRTGLRRYLTGGVVGQDVDLPFVVSPKTRDQEEVNSLLDRFERYAKATYPQVKRNPTKSSIYLEFVAARLCFDLVPMLATDAADEQILLRADGQRRRTSVQKHIEFIRSRTRDSNELSGPVRFNECVRLFKWWRELRQSESEQLPLVPTILIDLVCAKAYDECRVQPTYPETLAQWFSWAAHAVRRRQLITFSDYGVPPPAPAGEAWAVLDPVYPGNNVVSTWSGWAIEEFTLWLERGRDLIHRAIRHDDEGDDAGSLRCLVQLFGTSFKSHCGDGE